MSNTSTGSTDCRNILETASTGAAGALFSQPGNIGQTSALAQFPEGLTLGHVWAPPHFGDPLAFVWAHFGHPLTLFGHFGAHLGTTTFWAPLNLVLGKFGHGNFLGTPCPYFGHSGTCLGTTTFWPPLDVILGTFWAPLGLVLGSFGQNNFLGTPWHCFGHILGTPCPCLGLNFAAGKDQGRAGRKRTGTSHTHL